MPAFLIEMHLCRDLMLPQRTEKRHAVIHRDGFVVGGVDQQRWRHQRVNPGLQGVGLNRFLIGPGTQQAGSGAFMSNAITHADQRIDQDHRIRAR